MDSEAWPQATATDILEKNCHLIDSLLQREYFDWADDVEESEIYNKVHVDSLIDERHHRTDTRLQQEHPGWTGGTESPKTCTLVGEEGLTDEEQHQADSLLQEEQFDWIDDVESSETCIQVNGGHVADEEYHRADGLLQQELTGWAGDVESSILGKPLGGAEDQTAATSFVPSDTCSELSDSEYAKIFDQVFSQGLEEVSQEFSRRAYCTNKDQSIHHFNWLGFPVYERSETPPAVSLLYILADPKVPRPGDEYRLQSILYRATVYVDPVLVYTQNGMDSLRLKGNELLRFADDRTHKFYTPHGQWANNLREEEDIATDDGDVNIYISPGLTTGNGFVEICPIRSRSKWLEARDKLYEAAHAFSMAQCQKPKGAYKPSPLSQSIASDSVPISSGTNECCQLDGCRETRNSICVSADSTSSCGLLSQQRRHNSMSDLKQDIGYSYAMQAAKKIKRSSSCVLIGFHSSNVVTGQRSDREHASSASADEIREHAVDTFKTDQSDALAANGIIQPEASSNLQSDSTRCETRDGGSVLGVKLPNGATRVNFQNQSQATGASEDSSLNPQLYARQNILMDPSASLSSATKAPNVRHDVPYTDCRTETILENRKSRRKGQAWIKRISTKVRTIFGLKKPHDLPSSYRQPPDSHTSTHLPGSFYSLKSRNTSEAEDVIEGQHIIIEFKSLKGVFSLSANVPSIHSSQASSPGDHTGNDSSKPAALPKAPAKGRSLYNKACSRFRHSPNTGDVTQQISGLNATATRCSTMDPYPWRPI